MGLGTGCCCAGVHALWLCTGHSHDGYSDVASASLVLIGRLLFAGCLPGGAEPFAQVGDNVCQAKGELLL